MGECGENLISGCFKVLQGFHFDLELSHEYAHRMNFSSFRLRLNQAANRNSCHLDPISFVNTMTKYDGER